MPTMCSQIRHGGRNMTCSTRRRPSPTGRRKPVHLAISLPTLPGCLRVLVLVLVQAHPMPRSPLRGLLASDQIPIMCLEMSSMRLVCNNMTIRSLAEFPVTLASPAGGGESDTIMDLCRSCLWWRHGIHNCQLAWSVCRRNCGQPFRRNTRCERQECCLCVYRAARCRESCGIAMISTWQAGDLTSNLAGSTCSCDEGFRICPWLTHDPLPHLLLCLIPPYL
jgi:hypothetical protein